jgi:tol-pal system protein YbgF
MGISRAVTPEKGMNTHGWDKKAIGMFTLLMLGALLTVSCATKRDVQYLNSKIGALDTRVNRLQESMAEMAAEVDKIKKEIQTLSGRVEENGHLIKRAIERETTEKDAMRTEMERLAKLKAKVERLEKYIGMEPKATPKALTGGTVPEGTDGAAAQPRDDQKETAASDEALYESTITTFRAGKYEEALEGFKGFLKKYPQSNLADNAQFWIGECYMATGKYEQAILAYQEVLKKFPKGNKAAGAMLRQALAFYEINDKTSSRLLLKKVIRKYPNSSEAEIAKAKLKTIK